MTRKRQTLSHGHFEQSEKSLSSAARDSRFLHMCRALLRFPHLSFIPLRRVVPLRGTLSCAFGAGRLASQEGALMGRLGASLD